MKRFFTFLFVLAFLPLTFACGADHDVSTVSSTQINSNLMASSMMGISLSIIQILVIIALILFIVWMIQKLKGGKNKK